jgi:AraC-like DNA-binding protein
MSKTQIETPIVLYPKRESATAFLPEGGIPFREAVIGITYPYSEYRIDRPRPSNYTVLEYVEKGRGRIRVGGEWVTVRAGDVYILSEKEPHRYEADPKDPWQKIWVNYEAGYFLPLLQSYGIGTGVYRGEGVASHFSRLLALAESGDHGRRTAFEIAAVVNEILHRVASAALPAASDAAAIRAALNGSVYDKLDLDSLSRALHLSKSTVIRTFKAAYGQTPYEYLLSLKMEAAKLLLRDTDMTVSETALRLAFSDGHYFSNLFFERTGVRPRDYRRAVRG